MDFVALVNAVGKVVKKHSSEYRPIESADTPFSESCYDSLDCMMIFIYISESYEVPQEISEKLFPATVAELEAGIMANKNRDPADIAEVVALV